MGCNTGQTFMADYYPYRRLSKTLARKGELILRQNFSSDCMHSEIDWLACAFLLALPLFVFSEHFA